MARGRLLYIAGADGTGKSTQAAELLNHLARAGVRALHLWLRFPFLLSTPLLAYARWRGLSQTEERGGARYGTWDFQCSQLLRALLPWSLLVDAALAAAVRVYWPLVRGQTVVCERFVLDMVVDLALGCGDPGLGERVPGRLYARLLPRGSRVVILDLDLATTISRRPTLAFDRQLGRRLALYRQLAGAVGVPLVTAGGSIDSVSAAVRRELKVP
jgi:Mrp family chromosome partitioning ATPase